MNKNNPALIEWAIDKIKTKYPEDVALLIAVHGHEIDNDGHGECFDYFIPATERGYELDQTFILEGIGTDLYSRSWERTEKTADLFDTYPHAISNAEIRYARCDADVARFQALQERQKAHLADKSYTYLRALELLDQGMDLYRTMMFEDALYKVRMAAGYVAWYLARGIAYINGRCHIANHDEEYNNLLHLPELPDRFLDYYKTIGEAESMEELKSLTNLIIRTTRRFLAAKKPPEKVAESGDFHNLSGWYEEGALTWRRLRYFVRSGNRFSAFSCACSLQDELNVISAEFLLGELNLLGSYNPNDLSTLVARADELEQMIIQVIESHGVRIRQYDSLEEFLKEN